MKTFKLLIKMLGAMALVVLGGALCFAAAVGLVALLIIVFG